MKVRQLWYSKKHSLAHLIGILFHQLNSSIHLLNGVVCSLSGTHGTLLGSSRCGERCAEDRWFERREKVEKNPKKEQKPRR